MVTKEQVEKFLEELHTKIISFHFAEHPLVYPFKEQQL